MKFAEALCANPDHSLPEIARDEAELEGIYRFVESDAAGFSDIIAPHFEATAARVAEFPVAIVAHDISECSFPLTDHLRDGFARFSSDRQGFRFQASLAIAGDGSNRPLGLLGAQTWTEPKKGRTDVRRWCEFVKNSQQLVAHSTRLIHVIDREGGAYELFHDIMSGGSGFVIRLTRERLVELEELPGAVMKITEAAERLESVHEALVPLSKRRRVFKSKSLPERVTRKARLSFAATRIRLTKPSDLSAATSLPPSLVLNLVCVKEVNPPAGEDPIEWLLATTEPIAAAEDIVRIVAIYRARWLIEEFFKALKTGCALERRQLESLEAILKVFAISLVVAWRILLLRHESRTNPNAPGTRALPELFLRVLRATGPTTLPKEPTTREVFRAVAALGGHIKNNGEPGWLVLNRGMRRLFERVVGWLGALRMAQAPAFAADAIDV